MPTTNEEVLNHAMLQTVIWQDIEEGTGEPAIAVRQYSGMIELRQADHVVLVNNQTVEVLCKLLRSYSKECSAK